MHPGHIPEASNRNPECIWLMFMSILESPEAWRGTGGLNCRRGGGHLHLPNGLTGSATLSCGSVRQQRGAYWALSSHDWDFHSLMSTPGQNYLCCSSFSFQLFPGDISLCEKKKMGWNRQCPHMTGWRHHCAVGEGLQWFPHPSFPCAWQH